MSDDIPVKPRRRLRFTTRTLLVSATIIALVLANYISYMRSLQAEEDAAFKVQQFKEELVKLRHFAGFPEEPDPTRLQVKAIPLPHAQAWAWRVFVPYGGAYELRYQLNDVPHHDFPDGQTFDNGAPWVLGPGLTTVFLEVREQDDSAGDVAVTVASSDVNAQHILHTPDGRLTWLDFGRVRTEVSGENDAANFFPGEDVPLIRLRSRGGEQPAVAPSLQGPPLGRPDEPVEGNPTAPGVQLWLRPLRTTLGAPTDGH